MQMSHYQVITLPVASNALIAAGYVAECNFFFLAFPMVEYFPFCYELMKLQMFSLHLSLSPSLFLPSSAPRCLVIADPGDPRGR